MSSVGGERVNLPEWTDALEARALADQDVGDLVQNLKIGLATVRAGKLFQPLLRLSCLPNFETIYGVKKRSAVMKTLARIPLICVRHTAVHRKVEFGAVKHFLKQFQPVSDLRFLLRRMLQLRCQLGGDVFRQAHACIGRRKLDPAQRFIVHGNRDVAHGLHRLLV